MHTYCRINIFTFFIYGVKSYPKCNDTHRTGKRQVFIMLC
jgi:hypothetical protein